MEFFKNKKNIAIIVLSVMFLFALGGPECPKQETTIKEAPASQEEISKLKNEISIRTQIMALDDKGFDKAASASTLCGEGFEVAYYHDEPGMESVTIRMNKLTEEILEIATNKAMLLQKLTN